MSSIALMEANKKKLELVNAYLSKRLLLKQKIRNPKLSLEEKFFYMHKLSKMPKNSSFVRYRKRCSITGRPRGYYGYFGLCRNMVLAQARAGNLPGLVKSSN